jgi:three-Cys-motif partner protein
MRSSRPSAAGPSRSAISTALLSRVPGKNALAKIALTRRRTKSEYIDRLRGQTLARRARSMADTSFFEESSNQSRIKSRIVSKYFWAWAKVVMPRARSRRIAYVDLFAGPGRYDDGTVSTPLLVLQRAIGDPDMKRMLLTVFNDRDRQNTKSLTEAIFALPGIDQLEHKPQVQCEEVGAEIVKIFSQMRLIPTLFFVDPWGYKGLSLALINSVLKDWGCDCIFFFNYNRINMGLSNPAVRERMDVLFGEERANRIREKSAQLKPDDRETLIIEELSQALKEAGAAYILPFCFKSEEGRRTMHHLIFATKNFTGYEIMKEIMAGESTGREQGVASFQYSAAPKDFPLLFALSRPLDDLEESLLREFAARTLTMVALYREHSVGTPYTKANYKRALVNLETAGKIRAAPPSDKRPRRDGQVTFADSVVVTFPRRDDV